MVPFCCLCHELFYPFCTQEGTSGEVEAVLLRRDQYLYESEPGSDDVGPQADPIAILDEEEVETYDPQTDLPDFDAQGTYTIDLVSQRRMLRRERSAAVNHLELPEATESTLMAHINYSESEGDAVHSLT